MSLASSYLALTPSSSRSDLQTVLHQIINASIDDITAADREALAQAFIDDVKDGKGRVGQKDIALALEALKTLGRNPTASRIIVKRPNLQILYHIGTDTKEQHAEAAQEALRCTANALLLIDDARQTWLDIHGGEACVEMLERSTSPRIIFLASRHLFLITAKESPFIRKLIEEMRIIDIIGQRFDLLMNALLGGQAMAKDAMDDLLKFTFNILLIYPRMIEGGKGKKKEDPSSNKATDDQWNEQLGNLLPSLLRLFNGLPPTFPSPLAPPLNHVIHALINVPVTPGLASRWFSSSPHSSPTSTPRSSASDRFHKALSALTSGVTSGRRSLSSSRSSSPAPSAPAAAAPPPRDTVRRAWDLFDITTAHYVPNDPDDASVRHLCRTEGVKLDNTLTPLVALLARLAGGDDSAKLRMKEWILPADLDRTSPLEARQDLLGRCLRLMSSVYFPHVKDAVGELLFIVCDSDPSILAGQVGYGNCAGFLFNKGIMAPPAGVTDAEGVSINPITGIRTTKDEVLDDEMTEEEKEREAERLFVLFDRLEKSGMGVNPIRKAQQEGKLENIRRSSSSPDSSDS